MKRLPAAWLDTLRWRRQRSARGLPHQVRARPASVRAASDPARKACCRRRFSGKGLGHALISEAFKIALRVADDVGCRCTITDAYRDAIGWYALWFRHAGGRGGERSTTNASRYQNGPDGAQALIVNGGIRTRGALAVP